NVDVIIEKGAVLAVVAKYGDNLLPAGESVMDPLNTGLESIVALKEAAIPPQHFGRLVARDTLESLADEDERMIRLSCIRDEDTVLGGLKRAIGEPGAFLGRAPVGNILKRTPKFDFSLAVRIASPGGMDPPE